jgi:hypothetical protein
MKELPKEILERIVWKKRTTQWNESDPDEIAEILPLNGVCDDCGREIETSRTVQCRLTKSQAVKSHFKVKCSICNLYRNPDTGKFDLDYQEINSLYRLVLHKKDN